MAVELQIDVSGIKEVRDVAAQLAASEKKREQTEKSIAKDLGVQEKKTKKILSSTQKETKNQKADLAKRKKLELKEAADLEKKKGKLVAQRQAKLSKVGGTFSTVAAASGAQGGTLGGLLGGLGTVGIVAGIGVAIGGLAAVFGKLSIDAAKARKNTEGLVNHLGGSEKTYENLSTLANKLGADTKEVTSSFVDFRKKGLSNKDAVALIKTLEDVRAKRGDFAAEEAKVQFFENFGEGTRNLERNTYRANQALKTIRREVGVSGTGFEAATRDSFKYEAALNRVTNRWEDFKADVGESLVIGLDGWITFWDEDVPEAVGKGINLIKEEWESFTKDFSRVLDVVKEAWDDFDIQEVGADLIKGFVAGIEKNIHKVTNVIEGMADDTVKGFKNFLGISSPSKVFEGLGQDTTEGYDKGIEKSKPKNDNVMQDMANDVVDTFTNTFAPVIPLRQTQAGETSDVQRGQSGNTFNMTFNVPVGVNAEEYSRSMRREFEIYMQGLSLQNGAA